MRSHRRWVSHGRDLASTCWWRMVQVESAQPGPGPKEALGVAWGEPWRAERPSPPSFPGPDTGAQQGGVGQVAWPRPHASPELGIPIWAPTGQVGRAGRTGRGLAHPLCPAPPPEDPPCQGDRAWAIIHAPPPMLYGLLNSAPATINAVNAEIISIFWRQTVIYSSHFSGGGSHAVNSSALPIQC